MRVSIAPADPRCPAARVLFAASDAYSAALYAPEDRHPVTPERLITLGARFVLAQAEDAPLGCGAAVPHAGFAELKRMFVQPAARGRGVGRALLAALEHEARALGRSIVRLETGVLQPEALGLYRSAGYRQRDPYGGFGQSDASLYFEKAL